MGHLFRFFGRQAPDGLWIIEGEEHNHLRRVLRLEVGSEIEICDGLGTVIVAALSAVGSQQSEASYLRALPNQAIRTPIAVAVGAIKPQTFDEVIPDLVEIGVDAAWIFMQDKAARSRLDTKVKERWQRVARSAAKQAKQSRLLELHYADHLSECLTQSSALGYSSIRGLDITGQEGFLLAPLQTPTLLVVGGEMGLSAHELELLKSQSATIYRLNTGILRATTAVTLGSGIMALQRVTTF